jgi:hypothetical protein
MNPTTLLALLPQELYADAVNFAVSRDFSGLACVLNMPVSEILIDVAALLRGEVPSLRRA